MKPYLDWLPPEWMQVLFVLFLSFLIGLEREERKEKEGKISFGGVRTFPLIGLLGYSLGMLSGGQLLPQVIGFAVVGGFLMISYWHKLTVSAYSGVTTEMSGLATYLVGAFIYHDMFWIAAALTVISLLLLELKEGLENLTRRIESADILTFTQFLLLSVVILPLLPNAPYTHFQINPFKTWLIVVAVSAVSYGSYVLQRLTKGQGGIILTAVLGGAYSSTVIAVAFARRSKTEDLPHLLSGGILIASGISYLRMAILLALFNQQLMVTLGLPFLVLAALATIGGWLWTRRKDEGAVQVRSDFRPRNPLEISAALMFAALFVAMLIATHLAIEYLGNQGVYTLASLTGVTDVTPFIMGMTQSVPTLTPLQVASSGILIAAASNNVFKGVYAYFLSSRQMGLQSLYFMLGLAVLGLIPLLW